VAAKIKGREGPNVITGEPGNSDMEKKQHNKRSMQEEYTVPIEANAKPKRNKTDKAPQT
jgi:hypothetical protein